MIMNRIKNILGNVISVIVALSIVVLIIYGMVQCSNQRDAELDYKLQYGIEHPVYYKISFVDGHKDTLTVWTDPEEGDCIEMYDNGGTFTEGNIVLSYIPYKKYTYLYDCRMINVFNVLYYHKLTE